MMIVTRGEWRSRQVILDSKKKDAEEGVDYIGVVPHHPYSSIHIYYTCDDHPYSVLAITLTMESY